MNLSSSRGYLYWKFIINQSYYYFNIVRSPKEPRIIKTTKLRGCKPKIDIIPPMKRQLIVQTIIFHLSILLQLVRYSIIKSILIIEKSLPFQDYIIEIIIPNKWLLIETFKINRKYYYSSETFKQQRKLPIHTNWSK